MREYVLDSGTDLGRAQLDHLSELLDVPTTQVLAQLDLPSGARCLDVGGGNGSVTRWIAHHLSRPDRVDVVDVEDTHLDVPDGVTVHHRDVNEGVPSGTAFDLVHTRLLLMHLGRRREILRELAGALAPGGWLVVADQLYTGARVLSAPSPADGELYRSIVDTVIDEVGRPGGIDYEWAGTVDGEMAAAGLVEVDSVTYDRTMRGGDTGMALIGNYVRQVEPRLLALGVTDGDLRRFHEIVRDPGLRAWWFPFVCTRGRAPGGAA